MTDCEAASGSWQLYGELGAPRSAAAEEGQGNGGSRRGWSCVGRGTPVDGSSALGVAWRGAARHGAARRGTAWRSAAWRGASHRARHGATRRDVTRRYATRRVVGRLACLLTRALACGYVRSRLLLLHLSPSLLFSSSFPPLLSASQHSHRASRRVAPPSSVFFSLRAVLLPSHREAASKQEPIWISADLFPSPLLPSLLFSPHSALLPPRFFPLFNRCLFDCL